MLKGKGMFVWNIEKCEDGEPETIAVQAAAAGLQHLVIKIADGKKPWNVTEAGRDLAKELVQCCQARGIEVWGWHYTYGWWPAAEAMMAMTRVKQTGASGYVINAEREWKVPAGGQRAVEFTDMLEDFGTSVPIALSSYRYPHLHPEFPWRLLLKICSYAMPQVYWIGATNAGQQLDMTIKRYQELYQRIKLVRPIIPTGAAFAEHGWSAKPNEVQEFLVRAAVSLGMPAANFWEWGQTKLRVPGAWETIANFAWPGAATEEPPAAERQVQVIAERYNLRNQPEVASGTDIGDLHKGAVLTVTGEQGNWYEVRGWVNKAGVRAV